MPLMAIMSVFQHENAHIEIKLNLTANFNAKSLPVQPEITLKRMFSTISVSNHNKLLHFHYFFLHFRLNMVTGNETRAIKSTYSNKFRFN